MRKLRSETGVALPLAAAVLLSVSLLVVAIANNAMQSSNSANEDRSSKRALAAAEAGLQTASNRLNQLPGGVPRDMCLTDAPVTPGAGGECPGHPFELGNDTRFTYWVTPATSSTSCRSGSAICDERVITSVGEVKGELRRLQIRTESQPARPPYFPVRGITGLDSIRAHNDGVFNAALGSNGSINIRRWDPGNLTVELGPRGSFDGRGVRPPITSHDTFTLPAVPVGNTQDDLENVNELINQFNPSRPYREGPNGTNRELVMSGGTLRLPPGDYNFCRFDVHNDVRIEVMGPVRIFIDAPNAAVNTTQRNPKCTQSGGTWGDWDTHNDAVVNPAPSPVTNFQLFVVGWDPLTFEGAQYTRQHGRCAVRFHNTASYRGSIFAPFCDVTFHNNAGMDGAISATNVSFHNRADFRWNDGFADSGQAAGDYERERWVECTPRARRAGDPESGC